MTIKDLSCIKQEEVIACVNVVFQDYMVEIPTAVEYWKNRFLAARVDWTLSFGMFHDDKLVGFIIHGIGVHQEICTAYNCASGVLPSYRRQGILGELYRHSFPLLKEKGVKRCLLEVVCENIAALKAYYRLDFKQVRELKSFCGILSEDADAEELEAGKFLEVEENGLYNADHYSWENASAAVKLTQTPLHVYVLGTRDEMEAYLLADEAGNILHIESFSANYICLLLAAQSLMPGEITIKNIPATRTRVLSTLQKMKFRNCVNHYEMERWL